MRVLFLPDVEDYLVELMDILYYEEYFGFKSTAISYVIEFVNDIIKHLLLSPKKVAPKYFSKYGNDLFYSSFKRNKNTQWYVFFSIYEKEQVYIVH